MVERAVGAEHARDLAPDVDVDEQQPLVRQLRRAGAEGVPRGCVGGAEGVADGVRACSASDALSRAASADGWKGREWRSEPHSCRFGSRIAEAG